MKKILIIDDDTDILEAVELILISAGYSTQTTTQGDTVLDHISNFKPDLIILDLFLSGFDGRDIATTIRENSERKDLPIIMFSAHPAGSDMVKKWGAADYLAKPFSTTALLNVVRKYLN